MNTKSRLGICEWCIPAERIEERFQWAASAGLQGIEIDIGGYEDGYPSSQPERQKLLLDLSDQWNISIPTLGINAFCTYSMGNPEHRPIIESAFSATIEAAQAMNIPTIQVPSFYASAMDTPEQFEQTIESFRFACSLAEGTDLIIGSENALSAEQQLELIDRVGSDRFRIYFDTRNAFSMQGYNSASILETLLPHICEVHIKDGVDDGPACPLGQGNSGFHACMTILRENHYAGWTLLENDYTDIASCKADINTFQSFFSQGDLP